MPSPSLPTVGLRVGVDHAVILIMELMLKRHGLIATAAPSGNLSEAQSFEYFLSGSYIPDERSRAGALSSSQGRQRQKHSAERQKGNEAVGSSLSASQV